MTAGKPNKPPTKRTDLMAFSSCCLNFVLGAVLRAENLEIAEVIEN
jgi:hypothetical protein